MVCALLSFHQHKLMTTTSTTTTMTTNIRFQVNDKATFNLYSDSNAGYIVKVSKSGKKVWFCRAEAKLLNGANSGEPDALEFSPGGFCGHTSGFQRWQIAETPRNERPTCFTLRVQKNGEEIWKMVGHGTYSPGCTLSGGHHHHYDFNF